MTTGTPLHWHVIALAKPDKPLMTKILVAVVALLVLFLLLRYFVRKHGGWRRCRRRVARELTLTRHAFGEPLRAFRRHRRGVRTLARHLCDPRAGLLVRRLLDAAGAALGDVPGAFPYGLRTEPGGVSVQIAARRLPEPPAPWEADELPGPQSWYLELDRLEDGAALPGAVSRGGARMRPLPVAVGMADDACVHLDLAAGPRMITVEGDSAARTRLFHALAAQLDRPGSGASVTLTDGVHPHFHGERLETVLRELEDTPLAEPEETVTATTRAVVCAAPTREQARRLGALTASGAVVCLVDGPVPGHSWALRVDARGRVTSPELGLHADCGPLGRAVAAAVRADRRRARRAPERHRPTEQALEPRVQPEQQAARSPELVEEPVPPAPVPALTVTGADLLSEPATARTRPAQASSTDEQ
ncbi:hypothetical protein [Streptomyces capitiformicae]|uniref:Uncharacterized protein n=1 Tax=Streptomyces capitiformicae TaxID=2014920 RepID=A0A918ZKC9_9ACTN|nr:hypothetical protein [Streptomyces capitiformicae]GHE56119.1 hypothetical protein GCM10017771_78760 [Streptomyces capitiformicae]